MYHFVFAWMYRYHQKRGDTIYKHVASYAVAVVGFIHLLSIISFVEKIFGIKLLYFPDTSILSNKIIALPFVMACMLMIDLLYFNKKRTKMVLSKYPPEFRLHTIVNYCYWFLIVIIPSGILFYLN